MQKFLGPTVGKPKNNCEIIIHKNGNYFDKRRSNIQYTERKNNITCKNLKEMPVNVHGQHPIYKIYKANENGNIYNILSNKQVNGSISSGSGYRSITLQYENRNRKYIAKQHHIIVYECFKGIVKKGYEIDHIDGNKLNNKLENLQSLKAADHHKKTSRDNPDTGRKVGIKLSKAIVAINIETKKETLYTSLTEASLAIPGSTITKICSVLQSRRKSHQGYTFIYHKADDIDDEIWVCLLNPLYKGIEVSSLGRVKTKRGNISYGVLHNTYMRVSVSQNNVPKSVFVHRLICEAFLGFQPDMTYTVDHIDKNRINNNVYNLRWATRTEQALNRKWKKAQENL